MAKENICGKAFEELTNDEMMECNGGIISLTPGPVTITATTLPCGIGASISAIGVSIYLTVKD